MGATPVYEIPAGAAASVVAFDGGVSSNGLGFAINSDDEEVVDLTMDNPPQPNGFVSLIDDIVANNEEVSPCAAAASVVAFDGGVSFNGSGFCYE